MKKGFTILELLVASLLLGMLMTTLTMIFNQSSISWRVGKATIADIDDTSDGISSVHAAADNLFVVNGEPYLLTSIWEEKNPQDDASSTLRKNRPIASENGSTGTAGQPSNVQDEGKDEGSYSFRNMFQNVGTGVKNSAEPGSWSVLDVGKGDAADPANLYTVNVKSAGPDKKFDTYDDIWSFPDDFN